jgi:hypothetical protein
LPVSDASRRSSLRSPTPASIGSTYIIIAAISVVFCRAHAQRNCACAIIRIAAKFSRGEMRRSMKYMLVGFVLAAIAGVEVFHAFAADETSGILQCAAPESKAAAFREMLLLHLYSH